MKHHLDQLTARTRALSAAADPDRPSTYLDDLNCLELTNVEDRLDALHIWEQWGRPPLSDAQRATAVVETITDAGRAGGTLSRLADLTHGRHNELLPPVGGQDQGIQLPRRTDLGLEL